MKEIKNAKIESTTLGYEDHGILTCTLQLDYGDSGQSFGGYQLTIPTNLHRHLTEILKVVGVEKWEDLKGEYIRVEADRTKVYKIGSLLKDRWFEPEK